MVHDSMDAYCTVQVASGQLTLLSRIHGATDS